MVLKQERIELRKSPQTSQASLYLNKDQGYIPLKKTVAKQELDTGLTREKIMEYLGLLVEADQFEIDQEKDQIRRPRVYECVVMSICIDSKKISEVSSESRGCECVYEYECMECKEERRNKEQSYTLKYTPSFGVS